MPVETTFHRVNSGLFGAGIHSVVAVYCKCVYKKLDYWSVLTGGLYPEFNECSIFFDIEIFPWINGTFPGIIICTLTLTIMYKSINLLVHWIETIWLVILILSSYWDWFRVLKKRTVIDLNCAMSKTKTCMIGWFILVNVLNQVMSLKTA